MKIRLKELREKLGLSQHDIAMLTGLHTAAISRLENHKNLPSLTTFVLLVDALGVSADELLDRG